MPLGFYSLLKPHDLRYLLLAHAFYLFILYYQQLKNLFISFPGKSFLAAFESNLKSKVRLSYSTGGISLLFRFTLFDIKHMGSGIILTKIPPALVYLDAGLCHWTAVYPGETREWIMIYITLMFATGQAWLRSSPLSLEHHCCISSSNTEEETGAGRGWGRGGPSGCGWGGGGVGGVKQCHKYQVSLTQ